MALFQSIEPQPIATPASSLKRIIIITSATTLVLTTLIAGVFFMLLAQKQPPVNPFVSSKPSTGFPLYYAKNPPKGFIADQHSVTSPHDEVILYKLIRGKDQIVVTEQARTAKMVDFSPFLKQLQYMKQITAVGGTVVTGYFGNTKLVTFIGNKTWVIATTTADVPLDQLTTMIQSLTTAD